MRESGLSIEEKHHIRENHSSLLFIIWRQRVTRDALTYISSTELKIANHDMRQENTFCADLLKIMIGTVLEEKFLLSLQQQDEFPQISLVFFFFISHVPDQGTRRVPDRSGLVHNQCTCVTAQASITTSLTLKHDNLLPVSSSVFFGVTYSHV